MAAPRPRNYLHLPLGDRQPEEVNVVIEIAEGSKNKYEYDKEFDIFRLDRALHSSVYYPGDYGFCPQTLALDGDPLDVLVLTIVPTFPGCLVAARPIGLLEMRDGGKEDDKVLAVPVGEPAFDEIQHFFETYKALEGKETAVGGWQDAAAARKTVAESYARFLETDH